MKYILNQNEKSPKNAIPITYEIDDKGCHVCTSHKANRRGYPIKSHKGKPMTVARLAWLAKGNELPEIGEYLLHSCGNRLCINTEHLFVGQSEDLIKIKLAEKTTVRYSSMTDEDIYAVKVNLEDSARELAKRYGVVRSTIYHIWNENSFAHIKVDGYDEIRQKRKQRTSEARSNMNRQKTAKGRKK